MADESAGGFQFAGPIWFITPKPPYDDLDLAVVSLKGLFEDGATGEKVPIVYAFSDEDLAQRWLVRNAAPPHYRPLSLPSDAETIALLERFHAHGDRFLGVDAEQGSSVILPITRVIDQLRRRSGG